MGEADRFRIADDRLKALNSAAISAVGAACAAQDGDLPPEMKETFECWCMLHGEPPSLVSCKALAADVDDFKLVGISSLRYMSPEELEALGSRVADLDLAVA